MPALSNDGKKSIYAETFINAMRCLMKDKYFYKTVCNTTSPQQIWHGLLTSFFRLKIRDTFV